MKKKTRTINVNDSEYIWIFNESSWPSHLLRVWTSSQKKRPWFELIVPTADPFTPKMVAETIEKVELANGKPGVIKSTITLEWDVEMKCVHM